MGSSDRDYFRDSYERGGAMFGGLMWTPVVKWLIIINVVVWILQIFVAPLTEWLALDAQKVLGGQVWRIFTTAFCHSRTGIFHIVFNMLFLFWFGCTLERKYGSREFLYFYMVAALIASIAFIALDLFTGLNAKAIGASGAVMGVTMLYACWFPRQKILLFFCIPIEIRWLVLLIVIMDVHPVLLQFAGEGYVDGTAHAAHLGGLAFGFLYYARQWNLESRLGSFGGLVKNKEDMQRAEVKRERKQAEKNVAVKQRVDELLDKVSSDGINSLTEEEREFLLKASKDYGQS